MRKFQLSAQKLVCNSFERDITSFPNQSHQRHSYSTFRTAGSTATWTEVSKPYCIWRHNSRLSTARARSPQIKNKKTTPKFRRQRDDMKQVPYWRPTYFYVRKITPMVILTPYKICSPGIFVPLTSAWFRTSWRSTSSITVTLCS